MTMLIVKTVIKVIFIVHKYIDILMILKYANLFPSMCTD